MTSPEMASRAKMQREKNKMNKSKFSPLSFRAINPNEKYLPEVDSGFPIPNELLQFMDCIVSTSKKENDAKGKIHSNLSEIGFKILLTMLALRNPFNKPVSYTHLTLPTSDLV